jgi:hypothetical protein
VRLLLIRGGEILAFGAIPLVAITFALATYVDQDRLALDFHGELFRQAELVREGEQAFDEPGAYLEDRANLIWPMAAVLPVVPLTVLNPDAADWVATALCIASLVAALLVLGIRDWRIYGATLLWPSVIDAIQTGNASLPLVLLVALAWRYRDRAAIAGTAVGVGIAVKFFLWPVAAWLLAINRVRAAAIAVAVAAASLLLMIPFTNVVDYLRLLSELRRTFEHESYTLFAILTDMGTPDAVARVVTLGLGLGVLLLAWRRKSLTLALAAAIILSPLVWRHFFVLLIVPLALTRPRLDVFWLVPIGMWVGDGTFNGGPLQTAVVLGLFAVTVAACEWPQRFERDGAPRALVHLVPGRSRPT